jgi:hypothetical protein
VFVSKFYLVGLLDFSPAVSSSALFKKKGKVGVSVTAWNLA